MPFTDYSKVSIRREFMMLYLQEGVNRSELCRRYGISRQAANILKKRHEIYGEAAFEARSRRPLTSPNQSNKAIEAAILGVREKHKKWGGRKIRRRLLDLGHTQVPAASTITAVLRRNGRIEPAESKKREHYQRFEYETPNDLWQGDFKGKVQTGQGWCYPLALLDDHSRFNLTIQACPNERRLTIMPHFIQIFRLYGLPKRLLLDNGSPWGYKEDSPYTKFAVWLMRLGIDVIHSRPRHPQTHGKEERFNRTLLEEVLADRQLDGFAHCQHLFDKWRHVYNFERPHEGIGLDVPAKRYAPSPRSYPETLPKVEYETGTIRKVAGARISFEGKTHKVGKAFEGEPVAIKPTPADGVWEVYYSRFKIKVLDLRDK